MSEAARLTAAAGLLSSCASPAAMVPSDSRRSRFCSAPARRDITGFICFMTRSWTAGWASVRRRKSSAGMSATSHGTSADIRTASGPRVRTAMAPTHVGATWRPTGSVRPSVTITVCASPSSRHERPEHVDALLGQQLAGLEVMALRDGRPLGQLGVVEVVEQVDGTQVGDGDAGRGAHAWARYSWMSETAIDPSPTALATRLIERARTSPATKTPGTLVSSG